MWLVLTDLVQIHPTCIGEHDKDNILGSDSFSNYGLHQTVGACNIFRARYSIHKDQELFQYMVQISFYSLIPVMTSTPREERISSPEYFLCLVVFLVLLLLTIDLMTLLGAESKPVQWSERLGCWSDFQK